MQDSNNKIKIPGQPYMSIPLSNGLMIKLAGPSASEGHIITIKAVGQGGGSCMVNDNVGDISPCTMEFTSSGNPECFSRIRSPGERQASLDFNDDTSINDHCYTGSNSWNSDLLTPTATKMRPSSGIRVVRGSKPALKRKGDSDFKQPDCKKQWRNSFPGFAMDGASNFLNDITNRKKNFWPPQALSTGKKNKRTNKSELTNLGELGKVIGIGKTDMSIDQKTQRQRNIKYKVMQPGPLYFTMAEEYDIHCRADQFFSVVCPDPKYVLTGEGKDKNLKTWVEIYPSKRKRRRHLSVKLKDNKLFESSVDDKGLENDSHFTLNNGMTFLRPPSKLVELVAETINESPDGLLQVQHVYNAIMARYPYFQYQKEEDLTSWRSSIRHALYQKWFRKVIFKTNLINSKGCYWSLNRKLPPKSWKLSQKKMPFQKNNIIIPLVPPSTMYSSNSEPYGMEQEMITAPGSTFDDQTAPESILNCEYLENRNLFNPLPTITEEFCVEPGYSILKKANETTLSFSSRKDRENMSDNMIDSAEQSQSSQSMVDLDDDILMNGELQDPMFNKGAIFDNFEMLNADEVSWQTSVAEWCADSNFSDRSSPMSSSMQEDQTLYWTTPKVWSTFSGNESKKMSQSNDLFEPHESFPKSTHQEQANHLLPMISVEPKDFCSTSNLDNVSSKDLYANLDTCMPEKDFCSNLDAASVDFNDVSLWWNIL